MELTKELIDDFLEKLEKWGMLDGLSKNDKESIKDDIVLIAKNAIYDVKSSINDKISENIKSIRK